MDIQGNMVYSTQITWGKGSIEGLGLNSRNTPFHYYDRTRTFILKSIAHNKINNAV